MTRNVARSGWMLAMASGLSILASARAGDLKFSDPASVPPPPPGAIGFVSREPNLDVLPGFRSPPPGYGEVAFFWWIGDPLTKERLTWELDQLAGMGVMGLQINYAHSDKGGRSYGLTYPSTPPLFSQEWWDLVAWFMKEAKQRGMAVSLSDYTLGVGQGWRVDELLRDRPEMAGARLVAEAREVSGGSSLDWELPGGTIAVSAHRLVDAAVPTGPSVDLRASAPAGRLRWQAPEGRWKVVAVRPERVVPSLDPTHPDAGREYARRFFGQFEDRIPGEAGRGLNFFFSDELDFGVQGHLWSARFADEFRRRKGYDLVPELAALFHDVGPRTPKVRLDYRDVMASLSEEGFFRPVFEWHQQRGMIFGCDHGGRGRDVAEFGDYFRTQRWNQGPGCDQPRLERDVVKNKVASSIAHLYERPRVWLEGYHSSGWDTSSADLADTTFANFVQGQNLLTLHGLYYSTHGGWWEWAPPCNHFRMPYFADLKGFMTCVQRLSYLLSQGHHRCDVAVLYPVAAAEADMGGLEAVATAFASGEALYARGIDFDLIDFESLARARVTDGHVRVSGEAYRVLVLPAMRAIRHSTLEQARDFARGGGLVISVGAVPEASDRLGRDDPEVKAIVRELFGANGTGLLVPDKRRLVAEIDRRVPRDFRPSGDDRSPYVMHRKIGPRDVFAIYNGEQGRSCEFRATGRVELWDPWTGRTSRLPVVRSGEGTTTIHLPLTARELQLIVFSPGEGGPADGGVEPPPPRRVPLDGPWSFEVEPTLDNRYGDFRWPPSPGLLGAEIRQCGYEDEVTLDRPEGRRDEITAGFGPQLWKLGPLSAEGDPADLEARLAALTEVDPARPVEVGGRTLRWQRVEFSWRWGIQDDPGHQGYHGLKEQVHDELWALGKPSPAATFTDYKADPEGGRYYLWTSVPATAALKARPRVGGVQPAAVWWRGSRLENLGGLLQLQSGSNPLLLRYDRPGRAYLVLDLDTLREDVPPAQPGSLATRWYRDTSVLPFDSTPQVRIPRGTYRFLSAPGLRGMTVTTRGRVEGVQIGGHPSEVKLTGRTPDGASVYRVVRAGSSPDPVDVVLVLQQERGHRGGAALPEPILQDCGPGEFPVGDWSVLEGLRSYSGGAWYRRTITMDTEQASCRVRLDLGRVACTADVRVNGRPVGVVVAPPYVVDLSGQVRPGVNRLEVRVRNTLANHYTTIPTRYRGRLTSGLLGPVALILDGGSGR